MSATICPICDYANRHSSEECLNCGAPLLGEYVSRRRVLSEENEVPIEMATTTEERQTQDVAFPPSIPTARQPVRPTERPEQSQPLSPQDEEYEQALTRHRRSAQDEEYEQASTRYRRPAQDKGNERALTRYRGPTQDERNEQALTRYSKSALATRYSDDDPYASSMDVQLYHPHDVLLQTFITEEHNRIDPEPWKTDRLPWTLPRRRPDLSGKIIHMRDEMEFPDYPSVLRAILDLMSELIWMTANQPAHKEGERVQITLIRLRTSDGQLKDARMMGYQRGANLALGDMVSFWGWKRRGSLMVKKGYNHTSKAIIITDVMSMLIPGLIVLSIVLAIFGFAFYQAHIFSFFHSFWS